MTTEPSPSTSIDLERVRADTPGVAHVAHLNNAGASLPPQVVQDVMFEYLTAESLRGGYETAEAEAPRFERLYASMARLLNTQPHNLAVLESATRAWNTAVSAIRFSPGDRVLVTRSEYVSNMGGLLYARDRFGIELVLVPSDDSGQVDVAALANLLDDRTRMVSLSHIPTQGGLVNPAAEIGALLRDHPAIYVLDACQSVGQMPMDVQEIGCDILSFTGRKFMRGPRGTGALCVTDEMLAELTAPQGMDGSGGTWSEPFVFEPLPTAQRFEVFEAALGARAGLGAAVDYALDIGLDAIEQRNQSLAARLRAGLESIGPVEVADLGERKCAIVTFFVAGRDCTEIKLALREQAINVSVTGITSARFDFPERGLTELVRASVHYYNTEEEVDRLLTAVEALVA